MWPHCASVTLLDSVEAKQSSWSISLHPDQEKVVISFFLMNFNGHAWGGS